MSFFTKRLALLAVLLLVVAGGKAEGVVFSHNDRTLSATVVPSNDGAYKGDIEIPSITVYPLRPSTGGITIGGGVSKTYDVVSIAPNAFKNCPDLTSVTIPKSIETNLDGSWFDGCTSLTAINVDPENPKYSSVDGVLYNKTKTVLIKVPQAKSSFTILSSVNSIGDYAFSGCANLTSVEFPSLLSYIGNYAFSGCANLTSIEFPPSLRNICDYAFSDCTGLTSVEIPSSVWSLYNTAFLGCTNLKTAVVSSSSSNFAFDNAEKVYYLNPDAVINDASRLDYYTGTIYGTQKVLDQFEYPNITKVELYSLEKEEKLGAATLSFDNIYSELELGDASCSENGTVERTDNRYEISGLSPKTSYQVHVNVKLNGKQMTLPVEIQTETPVIPVPIVVERTQTKIVFDISAPFDESCTVPIELYVAGTTVDADRDYVSSEWIEDYKGGTQRVVIRNLKPGKKISVNTRTDYDGSYFNSTLIETSTLPLLADTALTLSPSAVKLSATYFEGDATVLHSGFGRYGMGTSSYIYNADMINADLYQEGTISILELTGLQPNQDYTAWYCVESKEGGKDSISYTFRTPALTFKTLPAKATSNTVALICAETNLSDMETGAGFEWRRYDAPDLVPSTQSPCPVVDGVLTGALRNLSASTYYKFRPYYTSASGQTYYGEWSAFGTADAYVYFDPTVRTYEATGVTETEARVRGYAIAGSDEITEQGFEYWAEDAPAKRSAADVRRVQATGQFMTATLEELQPGTTYTFRVYVETAKGTTYGEEQTFTTVDDGTGIFGTGSDGEAEGLEVAVRGNLSAGETFVKVSGNGGEVRWTLTAVGGAAVAQGRIVGDGSWQRLDGVRASRGIYLLTLSDGRTAKTVKLAAR